LAATGWYGPEPSTEARIAAAAEQNRRAGFDLFEIPPLDPYVFDVAAARRVLAGGSLEVAASLGFPEHADISTAEPDKVSAGEALLIKALEVLRDLDRPGARAAWPRRLSSCTDRGPLQTAVNAHPTRGGCRRTSNS
jgi:sugar phosphate isomerase/epimerase